MMQINFERPPAKKLAMLQYTIDKIASKNNKCREKVLFVDDDGGVRDILLILKTGLVCQAI